VYAFDAAGIDGCSGSPTVCTPLWSAATGGPVSSSPAVADDVGYVGSDDGNLYAFDTSGGPLWAAGTGGAVAASPPVVNGVVYVGSDDGNLYAFDSNFDTSDTPVNNCVQTDFVPVIRATIAGVVHTFRDVRQGLNTGGIDAKCTGNESRRWMPVVD